MAERHDSQQDHSFSMDRNVLTDGDRSAVSIHLSRSIVPVPPDDEEVVSLHSLASTPRVPESHVTNIMDQYPMVETYEGRIQTFANWPVTFLAPEDLSEALFVYTGEGDTAMCVKCGNVLSNWQPGDGPSQKHLNQFGFVCNAS